jgi:serine protease AprX
VIVSGGEGLSSLAFSFARAGLQLCGARGGRLPGDAAWAHHSRVRANVVALILLVGTAACREQPRGPAIDSSLLAITRRLPSRPVNEKLTGRLAALPRQSSEKRRVLVDLSVQVDVDALGRRIAHLGRRDRRRAVIDALRRVAEESQRELTPLLRRLQAQGHVESYRGFTVVNRLLVIGSPPALHALAAHPAVVSITEESQETVRQSAHVVRQRHAHRRSWAIPAIGADSAWRLGIDGRGVVVGIIDAGASVAHEQLRGGFRGGDSSWHDPTGSTSTPEDVMPGHGTSILSVAVGRNVAAVTTGVAPGATWVACVGLPHGRYNNVHVTECAEWMLTTAQPDVLVNAWLLSGVGCDRSLEPIVNAWRAAEMVVVFPAGNEGPGNGTGGSPANYVSLYPGDRVAPSVGGFTRDGSAYAESSRGPSACDGSIYPSVTAPAEDLPAAFPLTPSTYVHARGTSVATGLVAGAAALLLQRSPETTAAEVEDALRAGARDGGPPGPDNTFGSGRLYVPGAIEWLARRPASSAKQRSPAVTATHR